MMNLSAVIITYNEEANIERCIQSLTRVADEVIVVDSFSTDRTKEICLKLGVRFFEHAFEGYGKQKNLAMNKAVFSYVLSLDADELLSEELSQSILEEKKKEFPFDAYRMNRLNNYCGVWIRHGDYYPDRKTRLWKKEAGCWNDAEVHEEVVMQAGTTSSLLRGDLLHYSFLTFESHLAQAEKFSTLAATAMYKKGKRVSRLKPLISSAWSFIKGYILKLGFLDGRHGYRIAKVNAGYTYSKYAKLIRLHRDN